MSSLTSIGSSALVAGSAIYDAGAGDRMLVRFLSQDGDATTVCVFDLSKQETYKYTAKATRLAVEQGSDVTDNVNRDPFGLELECMITDSPFRDSDDGKAQWNDPSTYDRQLTTEAGSVAVSAVAGPLGIIAASTAISMYDSSSGGEAPPRSAAAFETLVNCFDQSRLLTVKTKLGTYTNMVIESLSVPRDNKTGDSLTFSISLTRLHIVRAQSVSASDVANARLAMGKKKLGTQQAESRDLFHQGEGDGLNDFKEEQNRVSKLFAGAR